MREAIARAATEGMAIIVSSHQLELVERVCSRVLVMKKGRKVVEGTLDEVRSFAALSPDASLEEVFFRVIEGEAGGARPDGAA